MKKRLEIRKWAGLLAGCILAVSPLAGCGAAEQEVQENTGEKVFYYGDTTFNAENDEKDVNPHNGYSGWACIRYGIGETLFKYSDSMELEPWLATEYELADGYLQQLLLMEEKPEYYQDEAVIAAWQGEQAELSARYEAVGSIYELISGQHTGD